MKRCSLGYRLRQTITLQSPTTPTNGETAATYSNTETGVRAEVVPLRGSEGLRGRQVEALCTWRVTMRHRSSVTPAWRIVWGSRTLEIVSAYDPDQTGRITQCECLEVQP